ncbi:MAG: NAD(P)-binding domain-containing protein [Rubrivivax sp.]
MAATHRTDVVIVGAGHSGLAMSHALAACGVPHVLLERGQVAERWRRERWDSLRLLTPNWLTRLPGCTYDGDDPDGYMGAADVAAFIVRYAGRIGAPVQPHTTVHAVRADGARYRVCTDRGDWQCRALVLAGGAFGRARLPRLAEALPPGLPQLHAHAYRRPAQLPPGRVLVVGASASGVQLAQELRRSGREVVLAVGEHVRLPRLHRGRDIQWWMHAAGVLDQRIDSVDDPGRARRIPSPQLAGGTPRATLDLHALQDQGVELVGRLAGVRDGRALFSGGLRNACALADLKMHRLLDAVDDWARARGLPGAAEAAERPPPTHLQAQPRLQLALGRDVQAVLWATGLQPDWSWLQLPVLASDGQLRHVAGVVDAPGVVALGLPFMRRRKSSFIHGAEDDVRELLPQLLRQLERTAPHARPGVPA